MTVNVFKRSCPRCGHLMQYHKMTKGANDKRFQD
jgi:ribosomal protein S27AE